MFLIKQNCKTYFVIDPHTLYIQTLQELQTMKPVTFVMTFDIITKSYIDARVYSLCTGAIDDIFKKKHNANERSHTFSVFHILR